VGELIKKEECRKEEEKRRKKGRIRDEWHKRRRSGRRDGKRGQNNGIKNKKKAENAETLKVAEPEIRRYFGDEWDNQ
jgi:hypothetical protein